MKATEQPASDPAEESAITLIQAVLTSIPPRVLVVDDDDVIEERRRMAMTDALTGCYNRRYFMNHLRRELKRTRRSAGDLALALMDIDHFKHINDRFGHAAGDAVLVEFARRLSPSMARQTWTSRSRQFFTWTTIRTSARSCRCR